MAVQGIVLSSKPISISKATSTLASFVSSDTGAPRGIAVFLRRALTSFKELKQLHKELKSRRSNRRRNRDRSEAGSDDVKTIGDNPTQSLVLSEEVSRGVELKSGNRRHESNSNVENEESSRKVEKKGEVRNFGEDGGQIAERADSVEENNKKKKKKKRKKRDMAGNSEENLGQIEKGDKIAEEAGQGVEKREAANSVETDSKKKKKNKGNAGNSGENGVRIEKEEDGGAKMGNVEVKKEERKKRKCGVLEDGGTDALEEEHAKKNKRRKS